MPPPPARRGTPAVAVPPPPPAREASRSTGTIAPPPPPARVAPAASRPPLSRRAKLTVISCVALGLGAVAAVIVIQQRRATPPDALLLAALDREVGGGKLKFYPAEPGGYVRGADGRWLPLPSNGAHPTYGATDVVNGVSRFQGALSGNTPQNTETRPDKLADLTFVGNDRPPAVPGDNVVIVYVGQIKPPATYLVRRYPELADYPDIECAPTRTLPDGRRQTDLLRIVPGIAGFRGNRVAAVVDKPKPGVVVLNVSTPLAPGTYAIAAGEACFELVVR